MNGWDVMVLEGWDNGVIVSESGVPRAEQSRRSPVRTTVSDWMLVVLSLLEDYKTGEDDARYSRLRDGRMHMITLHPPD